MSNTTIAYQLRMSRNTVARLLGLAEPPCYERPALGSMLDPFKDAVLAMLDAEPRAAVTVVIERLRRDGYRGGITILKVASPSSRWHHHPQGGITILKEYLAEVRPQFLAARAYQRTSYLPGEIGQFD